MKDFIEKNKNEIELIMIENNPVKIEKIAEVSEDFIIVYMLQVDPVVENGKVVGAKPNGNLNKYLIPMHKISIIQLKYNLHIVNN